MKRLNYYLLLGMSAIIILTSCSEDKTKDIPEEKQIINIEVKEPFILPDSPVGLILINPTTNSPLKDYNNVRYKIESIDNKQIIIPADISDKALYPLNGSDIGIIAYSPYSSKLDLNRLTIPFDLKDPENTCVDFMSTERISSSIYTDTLPTASFKHKLCELAIYIRSEKGGLDSKTASLTISNAAFSGLFSLLENKFINLEVKNHQLPLSCESDSLLTSSCLLLPSDLPLAFTYKDDNNPAMLVDKAINEFNNQPNKIILTPGTKLLLMIYVNNKASKAATATSLKQE